MLPVLTPGDYVVLIKWPIKVGDIVVVKHRSFGEIIKRVTALENEKITLAGENPKSTSSESIGKVVKKDLLGKVIWKI